MLSKVLILLTLLGISVSEAKTTSGTEAHFEQEYRSAYKIPEGFNSKFIRKITKILEKKIKDHEFRFEKTLGESFYMDKKFKTFLFKDYYYDTDDNKLMKNNSVYRLRYRWDNASRYFRYKWLPLTSNYPSRCEIQYKHGYDFSNEISNMKEIRFEFRNESKPFNKKKDAPPAPWKVDEFSRYMNTGRYKQYTILPTAELVKNTKINPRTLKNKVTTETIRIRNHLNIPNIFGDMPNPDQAVIITFDLVYPDKGEPFLEVELELDRSIGKNINDILKNKKRNKEVLDFLKEIKAQLLADILDVNNLILKILQEDFKLSPLETTFKYKRIISSIKE